MNSWLASVQWLLFLALCRMSYLAANIRGPASPVNNKLIEKASTEVPITPAEKEWADKAARKYIATQDNSWKRWNAAMFER